MESEKGRAAFYQAHKDDPKVWGEFEEAPGERRIRRTGLSVSIAVRFAPDEAEAIRRTARRERKTYSEVVRAAVHRYTQPEALESTAGTFRVSGLGASAPATQPARPVTFVEVEGQPHGAQTASSMELAGE